MLSGYQYRCALRVQAGDQDENPVGDIRIDSKVDIINRLAFVPGLDKALVTGYRRVTGDHRAVDQYGGRRGGEISGGNTAGRTNGVYRVVLRYDHQMNSPQVAVSRAARQNIDDIMLAGHQVGCAVRIESIGELIHRGYRRYLGRCRRNSGRGGWCGGYQWRIRAEVIILGRGVIIPAAHRFILLRNCGR